MPCFCSTSLCVLPAEPADMLACWESACGGSAMGLMLDARLGHQQQDELLRLARTRGVECIALAHPRSGPPGLPAASAASLDRDEQRAARQQLVMTLQRAHRHGVGRVELGPTLLELSISRGALAGQFARGMDLQQMEPERAARAGGALDALCLVLDPALEQVSRLGGELLLPVPAPWPHQVPGPGDVQQLRGIFAGSPLRISLALDWWHVARQLAPQAVELELGGVALVRAADASGLVTMLPPGTGELDWQEAGRLVQRASRPVDGPDMPWVLTLDARLQVSPTEVALGAARMSEIREFRAG